MKKVLNHSFSFYYMHMNIYVIKSTFINGFLYILESLSTISQFLEIYNSNFHNKHGILEVNKISSPLKILKLLNIKKDKIIFEIFISFIVLFDIIYLLYDIIKIQNIVLAKILINFYELFYFRFLFIYYITIIFSVRDYYFFISLLIIFLHLLLTFYNFHIHHLYLFSPFFIKLPYDNLSSMNDIFNSLMKITISLSLNSEDKICKFFYFISFIFHLVISLYYIIIMIKHSYFLMNNIILSKIRLAMNFGTSITLLFMYFNGSNNILSNHFIFLICYIFLISSIGTMVYNPFNLIIIKKNKYETNALYYLFSYYTDLQNKIKFQNAVNIHRKKCGYCEMCILLKGNKLLENKETKTSDGNDINVTKTHQNTFFSIIYNGNNKYLKLLKYIMSNYLSKIKIISNNSSIFIYILYLYYTNYLNDRNLKVNIEFLFFTLNEKKKHQIEEQKLFIEQLVLINEFIYHSKEAISLLKNIVNVTFSDSLSQFEEVLKLTELLHILKAKKFKTTLFSKKNISNANSVFYSLNICAIFYEELFNEHISNSQGQIKDNFSQYEELINYLYHHNNNISLLLDISSFNLKIIRIGKNLINYLNCSLFQLFPKNLEQCQRENLKNIFLSYKKKNSELINNLQKYNMQEIQLIIVHKDNYQIYYRLLYMRINLLFKKKISKNMVFNGLYTIDSNIIISLSIKNLDFEIFIGCGNTKCIFPPKINSNNIPLKYFLSENNLTENNLILLFTLNQNNNNYKIYKFDIKKKIKNSTLDYSQTRNLKTSILEPSLIEKYRRDSVASLESSMSGISVSNNFKRKNNQNSKDLMFSTEVFRIFQTIEIILIVIIIILLIFSFIHQNNLKNKFNIEYSMMTDFRYFYRKIYHSIASFLNIMCISVAPRNLNCINFMEEYTKRYNKNNPKHNLNFTRVLEEENYLLGATLFDQLYTLQSSVNKINDKKLNEILNRNLTIHQIIPDYVKKTIKIINISVSVDEAYVLIVNSFIIICSEGNKYMTEPYYIFTYNTKNFEHINFDVELNESILNLYQIILNFYILETNLKQMRYRLDDYYENQLKNFKFISTLYQTFLLIVKLFILIVLFFYINNFYQIILKVLNSIRIKLKTIDDTFDFKRYFDGKIINLEKLIYLYKENPVTIISKLDKIYHKYKKELNIYLKKNNNEKENQQESTYLKKLQKKYMFSNITIKKGGYANFYILLILSMILITLLISCIQYFFLLTTFHNAILVIEIIKNGASTEATGYKNILYFQFMLLLNQTDEEISSLVGYKNIDSNIQSKFIDIFQNEQEQKKVSHILYFLSDIVSIDCDDFFYLANDNRLNQINSKFPEMKLYENLSYYCKTTLAMNEHKSEIVYQNQFGLIIDGIKSIRNRNYEGLIEFLYKDYLHKCALFNFFIYRPLRSIVNFKVISIGTKNIMNYFDKLFFMNIFIDIFSEIVIIIIIICIFMIGIEKKFNKIIKLKRIFSVYK